MLIEIHMIQNHSPANLNRDDLGAPKTCMFGGVQRARLSSQCIKRSIRNPGKPRNPDDPNSPREGGSSFATAMGDRIGLRTKFFPWLVEQELIKSGIPRDEYRPIVLRARQIATSKEKGEKKRSAGELADKRDRTPQLIHVARGHAADFVKQLEGLRQSHKEHYDYFLKPEVGFRESVRLFVDPELAEGREKDVEKIVKASWTIAKCRMPLLLAVEEGEVPIEEPPLEDGQPGSAHAELIAKRMAEVMTSGKSSDKKRFADLVHVPTDKEDEQLKEKAPEEPKGKGGMKKFMTQLMSVQQMNPVDIALFGRMTTSEAFQNVEAAMQAAHAISTHAVVNEVDYFTAVDDWGKGQGAGHVDEAQFASACFYKYFSLDWDQLVRNLAGPEPTEPKEPKKPKAEASDEEKSEYQEAMAEYQRAVTAHKDPIRLWPSILEDARKLAACALGHFLIAAAKTSPSGKQNSFASHCEPSGIMVQIKTGKMPTSYANAFAAPAHILGEGIPEDDAPDRVSLVGRSRGPGVGSLKFDV